MENQGYHYSVLFTRTEKQSEMQKVLSDAFPESRGKIFLPMREYYRRDKKEIDRKPLFPGYLFVHSDMGRKELHEFLMAHRIKVSSFLKELSGYGQDLSDGREVFMGNAPTDLTEEESSYLDRVLDQDGVQRMSAGYRESNGKLVVMEGPLVEYAKLIVKADRHERLAYLNLKFREIDVVAGLEVKPKRYYFPDKEDVPVALSDGTEVNLMELKKRMMERQSVYRSFSDFGHSVAGMRGALGRAYGEAMPKDGESRTK